MVGLQELARRLRAARTLEEFIELMLVGDVDFIDLRFIDLPGRWHHVTIPTTRLSPALFLKGTGFDGSSIPGFAAVECGDMVLLPVQETATGEEYGEHQTVAMIATAADAESRRPFVLDPRVIAARAEEVLRSSGHADESLWSPELEFYLFSSVSYEEAPNAAHFRVSSPEAGWPVPGSAGPELGYRIQPRGGYHAMPPADTHFEIRNEIAARMEETGTPVKYHHHENGAPGQLEIEVEGQSLVRAADNLMWSKHIVRNTAADRGLSATFMPKPLAWEPGNGLHFHIKLMLDGRPVFHGESGYAGLSETALHFIGGILQHGRALAAITSPSTNSYRRLRPGYEAPTSLFFSAANRSAAIRIPKYADEPETKTIEYRPSDASGNPYLTMAALLAAGLDGMERKIDPRENGFGPIDRNVHDLPPSERDKIVPLPVTLEEALLELASDCAFLSDTGVFPAEFVPVWIGLKRSESEKIAARPHPMEYGLYFDC
jgi:glutamine synthetase